MKKTKLLAGAAILSLVAAGQFAGTRVAEALTTGQQPLTPSQAASLATNVNQKVIVVLKDQVPQAPASRSEVRTRSTIESGEQHPILAELGQTKARDVHSYTALNAVAATVSSGEESRLKANPAVAEVVPDQIIHLAPEEATATAASSSASPTRSPLPGECPAPGAAPQLAPQALSDIHADSSNPNAKTARSLGIDGSGVTVAFIADGLDINNPDFIRANGQHVFVDYKDFSGEGTAVPTGGGEAFLDASSIAAQGLHVYNVSQYSAEPLDRPCDIRIEGVAPGASLVGLDIFGAEDAGYNSSFLQAIDYAVSVDHVNVLNESLGSNPYPDDQASLDLIKAANDAAVAAGTTVTASSGDAGVTSTIGSPSTDPNVISAGASTTYLGEVQANYGGSQFGVTGYLDNNISSFSSGGFEQDGRTVDVVAPGELNWALCSTDTAMYSECTNYAGKPSPVQLTGGTSESAPLTAGVAALVDQAYAKRHGGTFPTPALVKQFITSTADDIGAPAEYQGAGLIDAYRAVLAAEQYQATPSTSQPDALVESSGQFDSAAAPTSIHTFRETLTNLGSTSQVVTAGSRALGAYSTLETKTVTLSDANSPKSIDYQGKTDNYRKVTFNVPPGFDRLNASIAYQGASSSLNARVRLTLIDPSGRLADYSVPQGIGNYGNTQVASPEPGTWTAYIFSRISTAGGTTGPVVFGASVARYQSFGSVSPARATIPPGGTATFSLTTVTPATPGDSAGSLLLQPAGQTGLAVPVILRSLVGPGNQSFTGTLTGGNGRSIATGQTDYYQVEVPAHTPELNATVTLAGDPDNAVNAWLIDPTGQAQAVQTNSLITLDKKGDLKSTAELGTNLHVLAPAPGLWTLIVLFAPTVSGTALTEGYTVSTDDQAAPVGASGVPQGGRISVNRPAVATIRVTNDGTAPEAYFVDGRLDQLSAYDLSPLTSAQSTAPLNLAGTAPAFLVPSETYGLLAQSATTGAEPIQFDLSAPTGDPDVASDQGTAVAAAVTGNPVSSGVWGMFPTTVGPFGPSGATPETVNSSLIALAQTFDPGVTTAYGDLWQAALGGPLTVSPVVVQPGHSAVIPVIISPTAPAGTRVSGTLYLDDDSLTVYGGILAPNANTVAAIPYSYKVG